MPHAVRAGIPVKDFWDMTYKEIRISIQAVSEDKLDEMRYHAKMIHTLGALVGIAGWSKDPYPEITEVFPGLFDEAEEAERRQEIQMQMEKDKWLAFAESFNQKRKEVKP